MSDYGPAAGRAGPAGHAPLMPGRAHTGADRQHGDEEEAEGSQEFDTLEVQHTAGNSATAAMLAPTPGDLVRSVISEPGRPLDASVAESVSQATGGDPSGIRLHEGPEAGKAAKAVGATMFASGNHIVAPDGLDVSTAEGMFKAVHEVHHIVNQQAKGPVDGTDTDDGLRISDPGDRFEQEADDVAFSAVARRFGQGDA